MYPLKVDYFYYAGIGEFLVQALTALFVDPKLSPKHGFVLLNKEKLNLLKDLKIKGLDLMPYILRYQE